MVLVSVKPSLGWFDSSWIFCQTKPVLPVRQPRLVLAEDSSTTDSGCKLGSVLGLLSKQALVKQYWTYMDALEHSAASKFWSLPIGSLPLGRSLHGVSGSLISSQTTLAAEGLTMFNHFHLHPTFMKCTFYILHVLTKTKDLYVNCRKDNICNVINFKKEIHLYFIFAYIYYSYKYIIFNSLPTPVHSLCIHIHTN